MFGTIFLLYLTQSKIEFLVINDCLVKIFPQREQTGYKFLIIYRWLVDYYKELDSEYRATNRTPDGTLCFWINQHYIIIFGKGNQILRIYLVLIGNLSLCSCSNKNKLDEKVKNDIIFALLIYCIYHVMIFITFMQILDNKIMRV